MRWPTRILGLPLAALRSLTSLVRARSGFPPEPSSGVQARPPIPPPPPVPIEFGEFDLTGSDGEPDPSSVPTARESVRARPLARLFPLRRKGDP